MVDITKEEALQKLSSFEDVIFVGGTSEYLQGVKNELRDIDISVADTTPLKFFGYVFTGYNNSLYGLSGNRAFIPLKNVLIDIFVDAKRPEYITVNGFKCQTIQSMIKLREDTLKFYSDKLSQNSIMKIEMNLERLKLAYC